LFLGTGNAVDIGDEDQTMVRFAATLIVLMLVWIAPVSGYYFSYSKWLELPYDVRVAYIAGAYDTLIGFPDARGHRYVSWDACIKNARVSVGQLADNVQDFAKDKPRYQKGMIQDALFDYLAAACGPASQQTVDRSLMPPND